jgi:serine/threonine protein kinase
MEITRTKHVACFYIMGATQSKVGELIGEGGFARVYHLVQQDGTPTSFCVKIPRRADAFNDLSFSHELEILRQLQHPNIVSGELISFPKGDRGIKMEKADRSLRAWIDSPPKRARAWTLSIIEDVANGLRYLHETSYLHRDIKPGNILLFGTTAKIADFGFAKRASAMSGTTVCGTIGYMAPEVYEDSKYSGAVDMYALGCIFREFAAVAPSIKVELENEAKALTSIKPFDRPSALDVYKWVRKFHYQIVIGRKRQDALKEREKVKQLLHQLEDQKKDIEAQIDIQLGVIAKHNENIANILTERDEYSEDEDSD